VLRKQIYRNTWHISHPRRLKKHQHTQHFFSGPHALYCLPHCSYANITLCLIHSIMLKSIHPPIFMQPKDDITHFAKYSSRKYTPYDSRVLSYAYYLLKLSSFSVPTSVTSSECEILPFFLMPGSKTEKVLFISAFHPRVSRCSPAASAISPEHASRRASAL